MSRTENMDRLVSFFDLEDHYYAFLHNKLGNGFRGDARQANGMIRDGSYHTGWDYLSSIENRCCFRQIAIGSMDGECMSVTARNGCAYMKARVTPDSFPRMEILAHLNDDEYGRLEIGSMTNLWDCNEITEFAKEGGGNG